MGGLDSFELFLKFESRQDTFQERDKYGEASGSFRTEPLGLSSIYCKFSIKYYSETTGTDVQKHP